jgi:hypothetical protein
VARDPSEWRLDSVSLIPLSDGPFSLQLVLSQREDGEGDPFVVLSEEDDFGREYLAVVKGNPETIVDYCAIKLMRSAYRTVAPEDAGLLTNLAIEQEWSREAERILDFRSSARLAPRLIRPASEDPGLLPPLFYCRTGRRLFSPPCPRCGGLLSTCRDDTRLAGAGLPLFSSSLERFLYCRDCSGDDPESPLYAFEVPEGPGHRLVRSAADLVQDLGESLAAGPEAGAPAPPAFPCPDCVEAARKFQEAFASGRRAAPFWEGRWRVLNFYDSPYLVTGYGAVSLDEIADVFGGRPAESVGGGGPSSLPTLAFSTRFRYRVGDADPESGGRLFFGTESSGLDAVEIFYLKMTAYCQAVEAALEYARAFGRPHLDLHPRHFLYDFSLAGDDLPWLWGFHCRLHGLSSAARPEKLAGEVDVLIPPRKPSVPYAAPEVLEFHLSPARPAQLVVDELEGSGGGARRTYRWHGRLSDPYGIYPSPQDQDWILLTIDNEALGLSNVSLPARRDPRTAPGSQELAFISEPVVLEDAPAQRLGKTRGGKIPGARYRVYADFNVPSDLFSLGVILLRILVANDAQDAKVVARVAERLPQALATATASGAADGLAFLDQDSEIASVLHKSNVFFQEIDRRENRPNAIPDAIWRRAILLGLRLATRVEGFSICARPSDYDVGHPTAKLEAALQEAHLVAGELRTLLFQRQALHLEIQQVLSEVALEGAPVASTGRVAR